MKGEAEHLCRLAYARYSEGDFDGLLALFDPAVEVHVAAFAERAAAGGAAR